MWLQPCGVFFNSADISLDQKIPLCNYTRSTFKENNRELRTQEYQSSCKSLILRWLTALYMFIERSKFVMYDVGHAFSKVRFDVRIHYES